MKSAQNSGKNFTPKMAYRGIAVGNNTKIQPDHAWCLLFGDNLTSRGHYDVQIGDSISLPAALRPGDLDLEFKSVYDIFRLHSMDGTLLENDEKVPKEIREGHSLKWLQEVAVAIAKITMILGKLNKCPLKECTKQCILTCSGCEKIRYCSEGCQKADWKNHRQFCAPRFEVRPRSTEGEFYRGLVALEQQGVFWTPPSLMDFGVYCTKKIFKGELIGYFEGEYKTYEELAGENLGEADTLDDSKWVRPVTGNPPRVFVPSEHDQLSKAADPSFTSKTQRNFLEVFATSQSCITSLGSLENIIPYGSASPANAVVAETTEKVGLVAMRNINPGEEIFFHRGFTHHFHRECQRGFIFDEDPKDLPANIYSSPGFQEYIIFYYPYATDMFVTSLGNDVFQVSVCINDLSSDERVERVEREKREPMRVHFGHCAAPEGTTRVAKMTFDDYRLAFLGSE